MICSVCQEQTTKPFITYDCDKYICSWICSNRNPMGTITMDRIVNFKDFNAPLPVIPKKFLVKSDREINSMTNINRYEYERQLDIQMNLDPVKLTEQIEIVNMYSDSDTEYSEDSDEEECISE